MINEVYNMGFNGIKFDTSVPGMIPWEIVVAYFILTPLVVYGLSRRLVKSSFTTIDFVYISIGGAFSVVWEFYVGSFIARFFPSSPFLGIGFWGRLFILLIVASLVRKPGVGAMSLTIYTLLADLFHYGFAGQPLYFIYEAFTYGLFIDAVIIATRGNLFNIRYSDSIGTSLKIKRVVLIAIEGAIIGILCAIPDPIFYLGFLNPLIHGAIVNWATIQFDVLASVPGDAIVGILGAFAGQRVARAVGH
ncbi:hypothetical protein SULI_13465 [Saccharolobus solfataricus]|uniref:Uncharacterized protein n=4 Tax=Saccharolobus solfataricus TaxID=2287 RepID=Q97X96_SACS2|nr:Hypothetical protein SSO1858 [Saccharolobus solfataricus P2]AKA74740.2 hypothetical protein SULB_2646 [Saccharolobus solfataricus]AKA77435.2 hypothetical protein SULC_2642 [Saccharolobus solfataricus]AKA80126.2 hypothetical protein SULA_2645 [Saccharolobus solfataricus]AZF69206.1 hypothetical protein SULG_13465 [Saccharolobus solfataricus]